MAQARIELTGIECIGRHGANPGEQLEGQPFVVDLDVLLDVGGDHLDDTIDYRQLVELVRGTVAGPSVQLLENVAEAVARAVYDLSRVVEVTATVHKPRAAEGLDLEDVAAEATIGG